MLVKTLINVATSFTNVVGEGIMVISSQKEQKLKEEDDLDFAGEKKEQPQYDEGKAATNVSLFLSLTSLASIASSFFGSYLLNYFTVEQIFMLSTILPCLSLIAGLIAYEFKNPKADDGVLSIAKANWKTLLKYIKLPQFYKPLIFIFLVVIAPGITDAMFYFDINVLGFTATTFAWVNLISSIASIVGIWCYRAFFSKAPLWKYLLVTTICYSIVQSSNLLLAT